MRFRSLVTAFLLASSVPGYSADLKPDATTDIPESAKRPVVVTLGKAESGKQKAEIPKAELPEGMELTVAAGAPLVMHPIMGCLDDRGRLFLGDATGVNWNKKQLEANPPNRVLMLEDTDKDGAYDKSTIFADKMTFPQGACWLDGSLYVCSPPGLWKLTDKDGDGVAEEREMIVGGFEYTGNAADVHGPFLHPNGRLYWCHGRKGHKVVQKDGTLVHEGLASGIWSCKPDGSDVQWHSLASGDNPVEVDFTPEGEIIGTQNLYYSQPRGDTIVHWLYGGVYERADQMKAIAGLPRTLETMPVMYNFGHVAVSGACFARSGLLFNSDSRRGTGALHYLVTHFNTQRVVRMELTRDGASYKATEHEFLRLTESPDVHFTDVMEDADGSLLVVDTGGWFRIGCPSSLMAKPDIAGAVYRVRKKDAPMLAKTGVNEWVAGRPESVSDRSTSLSEKSICQALTTSKRPHELLKVMEEVSVQCDRGVRFSNQVFGSIYWNVASWSRDDTILQHAAAAAIAKLLSQSSGGYAIAYDGNGDLERADKVFCLGRLAFAAMQDAKLPKRDAQEKVKESSAGKAEPAIDEARRAVWSQLVEEALNGIEDEGKLPKERGVLHPETIVPALKRAHGALETARPRLGAWLEGSKLSARQLEALELLVGQSLAQSGGAELLGLMLSHRSVDVRQSAVRILAEQTAGVTNDAWLPPLEKSVADAQPGDLPLLLEAIKKLKTDKFNTKLQAIADDTKQPLPLRLKALDAMKGAKMTPATFAMLQDVLMGSNASAAARIQAAGMLSAASLDATQAAALAPALATVGPVELEDLTALIKKTKDAALLRTLSTELAKNPSISALQESHYRNAFADKPTEIFETIVLPALRKATEFIEMKKRLLPALAANAALKGKAAEGRKHFEAGKGTCIACHQIGSAGRPIGPDLSKIGAIRTERDLMESILFPSNTLARDYEAHVIETSDGQSCMGVIKSHTAEGLLVVDVAGQEKTVPHGSIVANTTLTTSLMPMGLDGTMSEQELCDLVAWLRSLK